MREVITRENAIGAVQTLVTALVLQKISKRHRWSLIGGLAALELPLRFMDDEGNSTGRELFFILMSSAYVLLAGIMKLFAVGARRLARALSARRSALQAEPHARPQPTVQPVSVDEIVYFIKATHPTLEELVSRYGESRDELFAVLESKAGTKGDIVVLV